MRKIRCFIAEALIPIACFFLSLTAYLNIPGLFDKFADNIDQALPIILYYDHHDLSTQHSITSKIKEFYFKNDVRREKETNLTNVGWPICLAK